MIALALCNREVLLMELDVLTVEEAARVLGVDHDVIVPLLEANEIAGRLIEGSWRTTRRALACYVDGAPLQVSCCTPTSGSEGGGCCCC
jgi:excisionase family DNA binding protein